MPVGQDIGTNFLVSARQDANNQIKVKSIRNCYVEIDNESAIRNMLTMSSVSFVEENDKIFLIGDTACTISNIFKRDVNRPMSGGVLSPGEVDAERIIKVLLSHILDKAVTPGEFCCFSVPGNPVDKEIDIVYHSAMFTKILGSLGYNACPLNEASAVVFSNAAKEQFSAIGISAGAGMVNVCLMYKTIPGVSFSIIGSGDAIDSAAAKATGTSATRIQAIKEKGVDLMNPTDGDPRTIREREAIAIYYKALILKILGSLKDQFIRNKRADFELPNAIPIIIAGGTAMAKNFLELFKSAFSTLKDWPIPVSEIRLASNPLEDIAKGCLVYALNKESQNK